MMKAIYSHIILFVCLFCLWGCIPVIDVDDEDNMEYEMPDIFLTKEDIPVSIYPLSDGYHIEYDAIPVGLIYNKLLETSWYEERSMFLMSTGDILSITNFPDGYAGFIKHSFNKEGKDNVYLGPKSYDRYDYLLIEKGNILKIDVNHGYGPPDEYRIIVLEDNRIIALKNKDFDIQDGTLYQISLFIPAIVVEDGRYDEAVKHHN